MIFHVIKTIPCINIGKDKRINLIIQRCIPMKPLFYYRIIEKIYNFGLFWDNMAPLEENAIDFAHTNINSEPNKMIDTNHYSLEYCLAHSGESINERFRSDRPDEIDLEIANMISTHRTKMPIVVYRGVCEAVFRQMVKNAKNMDNTDLFEKAFLQTSLVKGHEIHSQYRLRIYVPEKAQAVYLGNVNEEQFYYEVDLQHGAKLKIVSVDKEYINCKLI